MLAAAICFLFTVSGSPHGAQAFFRAWAPAGAGRDGAGLSFLTSFDAITQGVIDLRDLVLFGSLIVVALFINVTLIELNKGS